MGSDLPAQSEESTHATIDRISDRISDLGHKIRHFPILSKPREGREAGTRLAATYVHYTASSSWFSTSPTQLELC